MSTSRSCASGRVSRFSRRNWPVMRRWTSRCRPFSNSATMYLARRVSRRIAQPRRARANAAGVVPDTVFGQRTRTSRIRAPSMPAARSPRTTVSTSGNSGIGLNSKGIRLKAVRRLAFSIMVHVVACMFLESIYDAKAAHLFKTQQNGKDVEIWFHRGGAEFAERSFRAANQQQRNSFLRSLCASAVKSELGFERIRRHFMGGPACA
jgi:hypothetical protein